MTGKSAFFFGFVFLLSVFAVAPLVSASYEWTGAVSTDWSAAGNWNADGSAATTAPTTGDTVTIPSSTANSPVLTADIEVDSITVQSGATLDLQGFDVTGYITNNGTIRLFGADYTNVSDASTSPDTQTVTGTVTNGDTSTVEYVWDTNNANIQYNHGIRDFALGYSYHNLVLETNLWSYSGSTITVDGTLTITASQKIASLPLAKSNNTETLEVVIDANAGDVSLESSNDIHLSGSSASSDAITCRKLSVTASGKTITLPASVTTIGNEYATPPYNGDQSYSGQKIAASGSNLTLTTQRSGELTFAAGTTIAVGGDFSATTDNAAITASGALTIEADGAVTMDAGSGTISAGGDLTVTSGGNQTYSSNITATANLTLDAGSVGTITLSSNKTVDVASGTLTLEGGTFVNSGTVTANTLSLDATSSAVTLNNSGGSLTSGATTVTTAGNAVTVVGSTATGATNLGDVTCTATGGTLTFSNGNTNANSLAYGSAGTLAVSGGTLNVTGAIDFSGGTFTISDTNSATVSAGSMNVTGGSLTNRGTLNVTNALSLAPATGNTATLTNNAGGSLTAGTMTLDATNGNVELNNASGTLNVTTTTAVTTSATNAVSITGGGTAGNTSFASLSVDGTSGGGTLSFGGAISVTGDMELKGAAGNLLTIGGTSATIQLAASQTNGEYLSVNTSNVHIADTSGNVGGAVYSATNSQGSSGNPNTSGQPDNGWLLFSSDMEYVWTGATDAAWDVDTNWNTGVAPGNLNTDKITVTAVSVGAHTPVLTADITAESLTIEADAEINLGSHSVTATTFENNGTVILAGTQTIGGTPTITITNSATSTVRYTGNTSTLPMGTSYGNLEFDATSGALTVSSASNVTVAGTLSVTGTNAANITLNTVSSGATPPATLPVVLSNTSANLTLKSTSALTLSGRATPSPPTLSDVTCASLSLTVLPASATSPNITLPASVTTSGDQNYSGNISATGDLSLTASGSGNVTFAAGSTLTTAGDLRITANGGSIALGDGMTVNATGAADVSAGGVFLATLGTGSFSASSITRSGNGESQLSGTFSATSGGISFGGTGATYISGAATLSPTNGGLSFGGDLYIAAGDSVQLGNGSTSPTISVAGNFALFSGTLDLRENLSVGKDLILLGAGADINDGAAASGASGAAGVFAYHLDDRPSAPNLAAFPTVFPDTTTPVPGADASYTNAAGSFAADSLGGKTLAVGGNFYANGIGLNPNAGWTLSIPANDNATAAFAEAHNCTIANCTVSANGGGGGSGPWLAAAESTDGTPTNTNVAFDRLRLKPYDSTATDSAPWEAGSYTIRDNVVRLAFGYFDGANWTQATIENTNNEISALVSSIKYNSGQTVFEGAYTDANCTTSTDGRDDITGLLYLRTNADGTGAWNTDATGTSAGDAESTDADGNHQTAVVNIEIQKAVANLYAALRDNRKNRIAHYSGANTGTEGNGEVGKYFDAVGDRCAPVLVEVLAGKHAHTETGQHPADGHNYFELRWSEAVAIDNLAAAAENVRADAYPPSAGAAGNAGGAISSVGVSGYFNLAGFNLEAGSRDGACADSLYRNWDATAGGTGATDQTHRLRVYLAGYSEALSSNSYNWERFWQGYIASATSPVGCTVSVPAAANLVTVRDTPQPLTGTGAITGVPFSACKEGLTVTAATNADGSTGWDISPPGITPFRNADNTSPEGFYEIVYMDTDTSGAQITRMEVHVLDDADKASNWISRQGWHDAHPPVFPDTRGGLRGSSAIKNPSAPGSAILFSELSITGAFSFSVVGSSQSFSGSDFQEEVSSIVFDGSDTSTISTVDDPHFSLGITGNSSLTTVDEFTFSFTNNDSNEGRFITDLAGNLMRNASGRCLNAAPPRFLLTVQPMQDTSSSANDLSQKLYVAFTKRVKIEGMEKNIRLLINGANVIDTGVAAELLPGKSGQYQNGCVLTLTRRLTLDELTDASLVITPTVTGSSTSICDELGNYMRADASHRVTNFGVNVAMPLYMSDGVNEDGIFGEGQGAIRTFDGTARILDRDITLAARINASDGDNVSADTLDAWFDVSPSDTCFPDTYNALTGESLKVWTPPQNGVVNPFNAPENSEARQAASNGATDTSGRNRSFTIPENDSEIKPGAEMEFLLVYDDLVCVRLKDPANISSIDPWRIKIAGEKKQRGGVTIFNNVIDSARREQTRLTVEMSDSGNLVIQIFTTDGNVVKTLHRGRKQAGSYTFIWDGSNKAGKPVARGMYFIRVVGPDIDEIRKVLVIKE